MLKTVNIGSKNHTLIHFDDELGSGNSYHNYYISDSNGVGNVAGDFAEIHFQNGPIKENGVNGCHQEDLLAIVLHRLRSFQAGSFACRENALAITKIEEAMHWLNHRTSDRKDRGVEGTSEK